MNEWMPGLFNFYLSAVVVKTYVLNIENFFQKRIDQLYMYKHILGIAVSAYESGMH